MNGKIIIVLVIIAIILGGVYFWFQNQGGTTETSINVPGGWQTYTNDEWGIEMKLPLNWTVDEVRRTQEIVDVSGGFGKVGVLIQVNIKGEDSNIALNINDTVIPEQNVTFTHLKYTIAGYDAEVLQSYDNGKYLQFIGFGRPGHIYRMRINTKMKDITDQILSTIRLF